MATEYKLSYTASEIDRRLGLIDDLSNQVDDLSRQADDENIMDAMAEIDLIAPVALLDGSIITSNSNEIYCL